jgi:molybdopterin converting factor small subunit
VQLTVHGGFEVEGCRSFEITLNKGSTVRELIRVFSERTGKGFAESIYDKKRERIYESVLIFVNDKNIKSSSGMETCLKEGDEVSILFALTGG